MRDAVKIPRAEYKHLKKIEKEEKDLLEQLVKGLDDITKGKVKPF